ncbi:adenylyltransferase/cytidyltransferase family protein, partial [Ferroplasma acidiphilum]|uniref:adenylyltransferase/cytidyltransferase family protein n=1 Tax=Ferroplasma acidiphilum TaxID=74969 RepID=UPI0023EFD4A7
MITLVGGTFNRFHRGHEQLLLAAYNTGNRVMIGITSDQYARSHKNTIISYKRRRERVEQFISKFTSNYEIHPLDSVFGNTLDLDDVRKLQSEAVARMNMIRSDNNNVIDRYMEALFQLEENDVILS